MKHSTLIFLLIFFMSCISNKTKEKGINKAEPANETELIIGERIDGPANIRNKPNGEVLFELYDNALVEVTTKPIDDWYEVLVYADIKYNEYGMDSITKNRPIIVNNDTVGRVLKTHSVSTGQGGNFAYAMLYGHTYRNNIKTETIIETAFKKELSQSGRKLNSWDSFIKSFDLDTNAVGYDQFQTFYNYENSIEDPSPGFRVVLLFENDHLIGLVHSRKLKIDKSTTHKLDASYFVTFFEDYPEKAQMEFVKYMNEWVKGVD